MDTVHKSVGAYSAPSKSHRLYVEQKEIMPGKRSKPESLAGEGLIEESLDELRDYYDRSDYSQESPWKKAYDSYNEATRRYKYRSETAPAEEAAQEAPPAQEALPQEAPTPEEEREAAERKRVRTGAPDESERANESSAKPEDKSGALTRRLVAATHQLEISDIVAEAFKELLNLRMALGGAGDSKNTAELKRLIRKMEKVVSRSFKKTRELCEEDNMRLKEQNAARLKEEAREAKIKAELRKKIKERKAREKKYLNEEEQEENRFNTSIPSQKLDAATEAQIAIQAEAIAAAETSAGGMAGDMSGGAPAGAEIAAGEGASAEVSVEGGASVDVEV